RRLRARSPDHYREFLAAKARRQVSRLLEMLAQAPGQVDQAGVAGAVAEAVVDLLEVVHVDDQQRNRLPRCQRLHRTRQRFAELTPVGDPGQAVDPALAFEQVALLAQILLQLQALAVLAVA